MDGSVACESVGGRRSAVGSAKSFVFNREYSPALGTCSAVETAAGSAFERNPGPVKTIKLLLLATCSASPRFPRRADQRHVRHPRRREPPRRVRHALDDALQHLQSASRRHAHRQRHLPADRRRHGHEKLIDLPPNSWPTRTTSSTISSTSNGSGALLVATFPEDNPGVPDDVLSRSFLVTSDTYNNTGDGTYGQTIPGVWTGLLDYDSDGISAVAHGIRNIAPRLAHERRRREPRRCGVDAARQRLRRRRQHAPRARRRCRSRRTATSSSAAAGRDRSAARSSSSSTTPAPTMTTATPWSSPTPPRSTTAPAIRPTQPRRSWPSPASSSRRARRSTRRARQEDRRQLRPQRPRPGPAPRNSEADGEPQGWKITQ